MRNITEDLPVSETKALLSENEQIKTIEHHFGKIMLALGLDLDDDSLKDTPRRVAKMFINEAFSGLNPLNETNLSIMRSCSKRIYLYILIANIILSR